MTCDELIDLARNESEIIWAAKDREQNETIQHSVFVSIIDEAEDSAVIAACGGDIDTEFKIEKGDKEAILEDEDFTVSFLKIED